MEEAEFAELKAFDPGGASRAELESRIEGYGRLESIGAAGRLACMAAIEALDDGGVAPEDVARARTKCSTRTAKRAAKTAGQLRKMPRHKDALARGEISAEHADAAADAAERTSPEEADAALADTAKKVPADRYRKRAKEWAGRKESDHDKQDRHLRQRRNRSGAVFPGDDNMTILHASFDDVMGQQIRTAVDAEVDRLWRADGGRDGTPDDIRTPAQRRSDAIANLLLRQGTTTGRPHPRYQGHFRVTVDPTNPADPLRDAHFIDGTPIPSAVLDRLRCISDLVGAVYDTDGSVLWQGRAKRLATEEQWAALVDRDGGCFCCGAAPSHCEAHHLDQWDDLGKSDIDRLLLVCTATHHLVHDHGWTIERINGQCHLRRPGEKRAPPWRQAA